MLHDKCKSPLRFKRWCEKEDVEVPWKNVVKGIEIAESRYFVLDPGEIGRIKPEKTSTIDIKGFIDSSQIDHIHFDKPYFVVPQREKEKAYFLFKEAISQAAKIAVGSFVMHEKEHLCVIESYKDGMLLTTLKYAEEVRDIGKVELLKEKAKLTEPEIRLANELISKITIENFDIREYKETFSQDLKELVRRKAAGEKIAAKKPKAKPDLTLINALKASIK